MTWDPPPPPMPTITAARPAPISHTLTPLNLLSETLQGRGLGTYIFNKVYP